VTILINIFRSKFAKKKRRIPHETSTEGLHKYFKPLNEISNKITSPSSETQPMHINDIPTNDLSQLCLSQINTSTLADKVSRLSVKDKEIILCNSSKNISAENVNSISTSESIESAVPHQSNICVQSSNTSSLDQNNGKSFSS
jgi:hypothetical protein